MTAANGGPAFPVPNLQDDENFNGMSLRDHFAGQSLLARGFSVRPYDNTREAAADCYKMADAMLAERAK